MKGILISLGITASLAAYVLALDANGAKASATTWLLVSVVSGALSALVLAPKAKK